MEPSEIYPLETWFADYAWFQQRVSTGEAVDFENFQRHFYSTVTERRSAQFRSLRFFGAMSFLQWNLHSIARAFPSGEAISIGDEGCQIDRRVLIALYAFFAMTPDEFLDVPISFDQFIAYLKGLLEP